MAEAPSAKKQCTEVKPCGQCVKISKLGSTAQERQESGVLWEDVHWVVMHKRPPCGVVGHLMLISKRHFQGPSTFSDAEAAAVGVALRRCERVLEEVTGCDRVYTAALGSATSGGHFHAHMMPIFDDQPPKSVTGTPFDIFLQEKLAKEGVEGVAADQAECARVAGAFRARMAQDECPPCPEK